MTLSLRPQNIATLPLRTTCRPRRDRLATGLFGKPPLRPFASAQRECHVGDDAGHEELAFSGVLWFHIFEAAALVLPACEGDTFRRRQETIAADHGLGIAYQPRGDIGSVPNHSGHKHDLRFGRQRHAQRCEQQLVGWPAGNAVELMAFIRARDIRQLHATVQKQVIEMEDSSATMVSEIFAGLCGQGTGQTGGAAAQAPGYLVGDRPAFRDVGAGDERCAVVESRRLEAVGRYFAIRARFAGKPPQFELEGWTDQARPRC